MAPVSIFKFSWTPVTWLFPAVCLFPSKSGSVDIHCCLPGTESRAFCSLLQLCLVMSVFLCSSSLKEDLEVSRTFPSGKTTDMNLTDGLWVNTSWHFIIITLLVVKVNTIPNGFYHFSSKKYGAASFIVEPEASITLHLFESNENKKDIWVQSVSPVS